MNINKTIAYEICENLNTQKNYLLQCNEKFKKAYVSLNYLKTKGYPIDNILDFRFGLNIFGLDELSDNPDFDVYNVFELDDLNYIEATSHEGEQLLSLFKWLFIMENNDSSSITIDPEIQLIKSKLYSVLDTNCIIKDIDFNISIDTVLECLKDFPEILKEIKGI